MRDEFSTTIKITSVFTLLVVMLFTSGGVYNGFAASGLDVCSTSDAGRAVINEVRRGGGGSGGGWFAEIYIRDAWVNVDTWELCTKRSNGSSRCIGLGDGNGLYYNTWASGSADDWSSYPAGTYLVYNIRNFSSDNGEFILFDGSGNVIDYLWKQSASAATSTSCGQNSSDRLWWIADSGVGVCASCLYESTARDVPRCPNGTGDFMDNGDLSTPGENNNCVPVQPEPVADFHLDECSWDGTAGEVLDSTGNVDDAFAVGSPVATDIRFENGGICSSPALSGGEYLHVPDRSSLDFSRELTVTAWFKTDDIPSTEYRTIVSKDENFEFHINANGQIYYWWTGSTGRSQTLTTTGAGITPGTWHHVAIRFSSGTASIFLDGVLSVSSSGYDSLVMTNSDPLLIGSDINYSSRNFRGMIDEILIFDTALTDDQVSNIYANQRLKEEYDGGARDCVICVPDSVQECFSDNFDGRNELGANWSVIKQENFTPVVTGNKMMLTNTSRNVASGVTLLGEFPAADNYVEIIFEHNAYDGSGADGMVLVLSDASVTPVAGAYGGSLGYANRSGYDGFAGGWIGFGIDEFGNFSNPSEGRHGGTGRVRDSVAIRGAGAGQIGYNYLTGTGILSPGVDNRNSSVPAYGHFYKFSFDTRYGTTMIKVDRDTTGSGTSYSTLIDWYEINNGIVPANFKLSLTGSTGGSTNIHSLDAFRIRGIYCGTIGGGIHHYEIVHDGEGLTCTPESVEIYSCMDEDCTSYSSSQATVTMTPSGWVGGESTTFTSSVSKEIRHTTPGTVTLGLTGASITSSAPLKCSSYVGGPDTGCEMEFVEAGFIFDVPTQTSCKNSEHISFTAVKKDPDFDRCIPAFASRNVDVLFSADYINPAVRNENLIINGVPLTSSPTVIEVEFDFAGEAQLVLNYPDAGLLGLDAVFTGVNDEAELVMEGSDFFVVHPAGFCVYTDQADYDCVSGDSSCSSFVKAGELFPLKVKAVCWEADDETDSDFCTGNSTTPNFQMNDMSLSLNLVAPLSGVNGTLGENNISIISDGEAQIDQTVSEVGVFTFTLDPQDDYLGALDVYDGLTYTSSNVGRFIPHHFEVSILPSPPEFSDSCLVYTYLGERFYFNSVPEVSVSAMNGLTPFGVTGNYEGEFWKLDPDIHYSYQDPLAPAEVLPLLPQTGLQVVGDTADIGGQADIQLQESDGFKYSRPAPETPVDEFESSVNFTIASAQLTDSDGVCYEVNDSCSSYVVTGIGGAHLRHGRLFVFDNFGPETDDIEFSPIQSQYWDGSRWTLNDDDDCTSGLVFDSLRAALTSTTPFSGGEGHIRVSADGTDTTILVNGIEPDWLSCTPDSECTGHFTFGISRGNDRVINWKEVVR